MIDTENKRRSVQAYEGGSGPFPTSDGTVDAGDRGFINWVYSGYDYAGEPPTPGGAIHPYIPTFRRRRR